MATRSSQYLPGQGSGVRSPHLHPLSGNFPDPVFQIELGPQRLSEFAGTGHDMGHNLHGDARDQMARICIDRSQQLPERLRVKDRTVVLYPRRDQSSAQDGGRIGFRAPGRHAITKHTTGE